MQSSALAFTVKELHHDLTQRYRIHGARVKELWQQFDSSQRTNVFRAGAANGDVLQHPRDRSLGDAYKMIPELNIQDISTDASFLLNILEHRATTELTHQYASGPNGQIGDHRHILNAIDKQGLRHAQARALENCFAMFMVEEKYGSFFNVPSQHRREVLAKISLAIESMVCVPQDVGELILNRQMYTLQTLVILIDDILESSATRNTKSCAKKSSQPATAALEKMALKDRPQKLSVPDLVMAASDQKASLHEYLSLLRNEPVVLTHAVSVSFFARPELVADEKGRRLPAHTDRHISAAVMDAVVGAVADAAIWDYIYELVQLLSSSVDKVHRAVVLQELSNVCHLEFTRAQSCLKRRLATCSGSKWFKRISNATTHGNAKITTKTQPEQLTRLDPQLHYLLRLCDQSLTPIQAIEWIQKLDALHRAHPMERESLVEHETDALAQLAVIVAFIRDLSPVFSMPSVSRKKGLLFVSRENALEEELGRLKHELDLGEFAVPIDNLLEPDMARSALKALNAFVIQNAGSRLGSLFQDMLQDSLQDLKNQYEHFKDKMEKGQTPAVPPVQKPSQAEVVEQRKVKEKTRPASVSVFDISGPKIEETAETVPAPKPIKVKPATAELFSTLLDPSIQGASITWIGLQSALSELRFSIKPKFGSVFALYPPEDMNANRSLTVHRQHTSKIEGHKLHIFRKRFQKVFGWTKDTFVVD
ncbi:hypothetical protein EJ05DRAFT_518861 [Pseudovirgaria hyperparasitica]|uniref:Ipa protein n=1 Tax=Pseudovirgaria hyperparasitica TaxID=470096 RepID=A0A6A6W566_9PEZI|nr:uncharacterized protein EJ05DRAFT_518861 [Pseudovirgaria hyperparasitica]KAF2756201.1 hypothetical protein EJ05DRAFT_518861 [Pseudovirgaria hyperparasitica]